MNCIDVKGRRFWGYFSCALKHDGTVDGLEGESRWWETCCVTAFAIAYNGKTTQQR